MRNSLWTSKEDKFLKRRKKNVSLKKLAIQLERTESAVRNRRFKLRVNPRRVHTKYSFKEVQAKAPGLRKLKNGKALISCPIQSLGCLARTPRWVGTSYVLISKGRCNSCCQFKGGVINKQGYRRFWVGKKGVLEHRYVMEKMLGRKLLRGETVHHGPGGRSDNRPENLELRAPGKHKQGWSIREMRRYLLTIPKKLGGLK